MKWIILVLFIGILMAKDNLATQTDNVLKIVIKEKPSLVTLPIRTNNWMSVQGGGDWLGLSKDQIHKTIKI